MGIDSPSVAVGPRLHLSRNHDEVFFVLLNL